MPTQQSQPSAPPAPVPSIIDSPEKRLIARLARIECDREDIRAGNTEALWDYIGLQWPGCVFDDFQREIIEAMMLGAYTEIAIKGCTKPGKGFAVAVGANCWFDVFPDSKVVITSSDISHATNVMYGEIKSVRQMMKWAGPAKIMTEEFKGLKPTGRVVKNRETGQPEGETEDDTKHYVNIANPKTGEGFSGQHGPFTLFIFDEASASADELFINAKKQSRCIVALSNPRVQSGWFFDLFKLADDPNKTQTIMTDSGQRLLVTVGGPDCRNVKEKRLEKPYAPPGGITIDGREFTPGERIPPEFYEKVKLLIPNQLDYARFLATMSSADKFEREVFGLGRFPEEDAERQLFLKSWFKRHYDAWEKMSGFVPVEAFGLDIAASEFGDETVLAAGGPEGCRELHTWRKSDTTKTVTEVLRVAEECYGIDLRQGRTPIAVDMIGLGKSVADRFEELGVLVITVWSNGRPQVNAERYDNRRAEIYGELSTRLDPMQTPEDAFALPQDKLLLQELTAHHRIPKAKGFGITPKERYRGQVFQSQTIKEMLGRSPDRSDALCYLFAAIRTLLHGVGAPTLDRPLILMTEQESLQAEAELRAIEAAKPKKTQHQESQDDFNLRFPVLRAEGEVPPAKELGAIPWPDFL